MQTILILWPVLLTVGVILLIVVASKMVEMIALPVVITIFGLVFFFTWFGFVSRSGCLCKLVCRPSCISEAEIGELLNQLYPDNMVITEQEF